MGQDTGTPAPCPLKATVAGTNVPLPGGEHMVVWFENQSGKTVLRAQFELSLVDSANNRYPASEAYMADSPVNANQAGLMIAPAQNEAGHFGQRWRSIRGMEVRVTNVLFADGTRWEPASATLCNRVFFNSTYEHDMREWNADLRADWNHRHPNDPMPEPALAAWLLPHQEGWR